MSLEHSPARIGAPGSMTTDPLDRFMREPEVEHVTGLSRTTRWRMEKKGSFPPRRQISPNCRANMESEIRSWLAERAAEVPCEPSEKEPEEEP